MKKYIVSTAVLLVFAGVVFAQEREGRDKGRKKERAERAAKLRQRLHKDLGLTEDQAKQFRQIMQTQRQAVENWRKEHGEALKGLQKQMREAMKARDKEKAQSIREKMKKHFGGRKELQEGLMKRLGDVLTAEQMAKYKKSFGRRPGGAGAREGSLRHPLTRILMLLRRANLTPEQKEKIKKTLDQAMKKIMHEVLTPEQRKKLGKLRQRGDRIRTDSREGGRGRRGDTDRPRRPRRDRRKKAGNPEAVEVEPAE